MTKDLRKQLREASCVRGKEKTWISKLSDSQLQEIFLRLRNGETVRSIARHIKKSYETLAGSSVSSLSKGVLKYKRRIKPLLNTNLRGGETANMSIGNLSRIQKLEYLADRQLKRIISMMKEEEERNVFNVNISKEIDSLTAFQKAIDKTKRSKVAGSEKAQYLSQADMVVRSISQEAASMTQSMTERDNVEKIAEAVGMVRTMLAFNIGTRILGEEVQEEFFKKYPSVKNFLPSDIITIAEVEVKS